jgi:N-acetylglucosamine-6-sulfatase
MMPAPLIAAGSAVLARLVVGIVSLASLTAGTIAAHGGAATPAPARAAAGAPNVLLIVVDDQATNSFRASYMPNTFRWLVDGGTKFVNGLAAPPLCCPSRAGLLTGDYPHNSGVFWDNPGYPSLSDRRDTLPVWLKRAGYRTGLVGKFMNGYDTHHFGLSPAPGFESWFNLLGERRYFDYEVSGQGTRRSYGTSRRDYSTDVFTRQAKRFIRQSSGGSAPWFLWLGYDAPHTEHSTLVPGCGGNDPIPADRSSALRYRHTPLPRPPSYNEHDVSDKPPGVSDLPPISHHVFVNARRRFHCTLSTDREVDLGIGRLRRELGRDGELSNTIVFYISDNGYFFGEHRIARGKTLPYEPALQVPYAVRVPADLRPGPQPRVGRQLVTNEDIPATILDYAGDPPACAAPLDCRTLDGRSMRPLLGGSGRWPRDRSVLSEISGGAKHWRAVRTGRYLYTRYLGGARELYDLRSDPYELRNLASTPAYSRIERELAGRLHSLRHCVGIRGRDQKLNGVPSCE